MFRGHEGLHVDKGTVQNYSKKLAQVHLSIIIGIHSSDEVSNLFIIELLTQMVQYLAHLGVGKCARAISIEGLTFN